MFTDIFLESINILLKFDRDIYSIIYLSVFVSVTAILISSFISLPIASILVTKDIYLKNIVIIIINSLMSVPPVVVGLVLYLLLSYKGVLGRLNLLYTSIAMIIAQIIITLPIIISLSRETLERYYSVYKDYFLSIKMNNVDILQTMIWETRHSLSINVLAGLGRALSEVGAIIIVGGNIDNLTRVMTTSIVLETSRGEFAKAMSLGIALLVISIIISFLIFIFRYLNEKKYE